MNEEMQHFYSEVVSAIAKKVKHLKQDNYYKPDACYMDWETYLKIKLASETLGPIEEYPYDEILGCKIMMLPFPNTIIEVGYQDKDKTIEYGLRIRKQLDKMMRQK